MFCANCGKALRDESRFCPACGASVESAPSAASPGMSQQPIPTYQGQAANNKKLYLGIAGGVLLLAGIGLGIYSFVGQKDQPTEVVQQQGNPAPTVQETTPATAEPAGAQQQAHESVGGIHLGMTPDQVKQKLGEPTQAIDKSKPLQIRSQRYFEGWYYKDQGLIIHFREGGADKITLLEASKLRFAKSGLNCSNTPEEYAKAYAMKRVPRWPKTDDSMPSDIGNGEYIYFGINMESVTLTIYAT